MSPTIPNFFEDKAVFLTGATGFCGKVILETLLRGCPQITKVYVLVRSKKDKSGDDRMREVLQAPLFDKVREIDVKLLEKVIPINGDVVYDELGLSPEDTATLREEVSVVIHSAALVHFGAPLQSVMKANVQGTKNMLGWAKELKSLKAFVYISTAYSNSGRLKIDEVVYPNHISPYTALKLCSEMPTDLLNSIVPQLLAGNKMPYTFSKHLAEILVEESSGDIPICIIRPSVVTAANKEPIPGWIDNFTGFNGVMAAAVRGLFHAARLNTRGMVDLIPVDHVANLTLAAAMSTGLGLSKSEKIMVYNCSSSEYPFDFRKLVRSLQKAASLTPLNKIYWYPFILITTNQRIYEFLNFLLHYLPCVLVDGALKLVGSKRKIGMVETYNRLKKLFHVTEDLVATDYEHSTRNTQMLFKQLSPADQETFDFDIFAIDHEKFTLVGFHGLKKYAALEDDRDLPKARKNFKRLQMYHHMTMIFPIVLLAIFLVLFFA